MIGFHQCNTIVPSPRPTSQCDLLNAAVAADQKELVRFIYKNLVYDHRFYSLDRVQMISVTSAAMRDQMIKYTYKFEGDYGQDVKRIRRNLKTLTF